MVLPAGCFAWQDGDVWTGGAGNGFSPCGAGGREHHPDETDIPWHRVVNAQGRLAAGEFHEQRRRLSDEGIRVGEGGSVDLEEHQWRR